MRKPGCHKTLRIDTPHHLPPVVANSTPSLGATTIETTYLSTDEDHLRPAPSSVLQNLQQPEPVELARREQEEELPWHCQSQYKLLQSNSRAVAPVMPQFACNESIETWRHRNLGVEFESYLNSGETYGFDWFMRHPPKGFGVASPERHASATASGHDATQDLEVGPDPACTIM